MKLETKNPAMRNVCSGVYQKSYNAIGDLIELVRDKVGIDLWKYISKIVDPITRETTTIKKFGRNDIWTT